MKKLFTAIRKSDLDTVRQLLAKDPALLSCTAKQPPKKDDGQSPLQVALKTGNLEIAEHLLALGADVNFIESETCCNAWRAPVLHDAITAAVMCSRWNVNSELYGGLREFSTPQRADAAFRILKKMLELGADVNAVDSYGSSGLWRLCMQARQILPTYNHAEHRLCTDRVLTPQLRADLARIFAMLFEYGADRRYIAPGFQCTAAEQFRNEPLEGFLLSAQ